MTDGAGRTGVGVERGGETYVIDPTTGALLADSDGHWTGTYLHQGPSNSAPALPAK